MSKNNSNNQDKNANHSKNGAASHSKRGYNSEKLRIGITCYPTVGGSGVVATTLGIELAQRGHEVHFISYERPFRLPENSSRIHFHQVCVNDYGLFKYPDYTLPLSVAMASVSCKHNLDVLHVHYAVPHATAALLSRCMLPPDKQPRIVTTLHGTDTTLLGADPGYGPAIHHALIQSDAVTTVSGWLKAETKRVIGFDGAMDVIHNFYEPGKPSRPREVVRRDLGVGDEVLILHSSNLRPLKRIDLLLESVAKIRDRNSFKLLILAGGDFKQFSADVKRLGLEDRIVVRENVLEIEEYLQAADLALYTSESESFCLSILEAMFFGCPSVATDVGGIPEVIDDGETGILVPFGNADAIAKALEDLISDKVKRERFGENARKEAEKRFSADAIIHRYEELYRRLLEAPPSVAVGEVVEGCR
ncbi:MAG: N-acetyl-alpha-D-glucosaminyl L-malate synthase BshA [Candidatus Melainabacteria bacterium]|nr:MAG: N-acetyl-alpha-D-glucosaminyl L-malate synthase BshA [Candidatus Melainabacteria bacterium]